METAKPPRQPFIKIHGYAMHEGQFNLARMFKETVQLALKKYPKENFDFIAEKLGISDGTLYRVMSEYDIKRLKK